MTVDICVQHGGREALRHAGLSAAAETGQVCLVVLLVGYVSVHQLHMIRV